MNTSPGKRSGARLPLLLLLGFLVAVAGVAVWLVLTSPPTPPDIANPPRDVPADKPDTAKVTTPESTASKPPETSSAPDTGTAPENTDKDRTQTAETKPAPSAKNVGTPPKKSEKAETKPDAGPPAPSAAKPADAPKKVAEPRAKTPAAVKPVRTIAPKKLPRVPPDTPLSPSPDPALVQTTALGPLPQIGTDGRLPRKVYAKPFNTADKRPRIAIVVSGLGLSAAATESAIQGLPGSVTLAFAPYTNRLNEWIRLARAAGHEVLINVPMEPTNYPAYDPGPQTLLTSLNAEGNLDRLLWSLSRGTGYVGVVDFLGSRFTTSKNHLRPVLRAINERGLLFLDSGSSPRSVTGIVARDAKLAWAKATLTLDQRASRTEIDRKFGELEQRAKRDKRAIGIASPYPVTLERIANWVRQLEARGFAIAPVSALTGQVPPDQKP